MWTLSPSPWTLSEAQILRPTDHDIVPLQLSIQITGLYLGHRAFWTGVPGRHYTHDLLERPLAGAGATLKAARLRADDPTPADGEVVPLRSSVEASGPYSELRAFVAGATGGTGQAIVRRLIAEGVPVRALVRNVSQAVSPSVKPPPALPGP